MNGHTPPPAAGDQGSSPAGLILVRAEQTCREYPSQWNAWDTTGAYWYLRAEFGHASYGREPLSPARTFTYDDKGAPVALAEFIRAAGLRWVPALANDVPAFQHTEACPEMSLQRITAGAVAITLEMAQEQPAAPRQSGWTVTDETDSVLITYEAAGPGEAVMRREAFARWTAALRAAGWTVNGPGTSTGTGPKGRVLFLRVTP